MRITRVDAVILGVCVAPSAYLAGLVIILTWKARRTRKKHVKKDVAIELESLVYAAEEVGKRIKAGEYENEEINKLLVDMRFFQLARAEKLRERFKNVQ